MKTPEALLAHWSLDTFRDRPPGPRAGQPVQAHVLPDGCQDLIWMQRAGERPVWFVAPLAAGTYLVCHDRPVRYQGYRLSPGTHIESSALLKAAQAHGHEGEPGDVLPVLFEHARCDPRVIDALAALSESLNVSAAARALGVSSRTLSRCLGAATGQSPVFWHQLARVRRAAQCLSGTGQGEAFGRVGAPALAEIALDHGYADQAHFSRECRRWFGFSPGALQRRPDLLATLQDSGYGTQSQPPTGVQISMRKPDGSAT